MSKSKEKKIYDTSYTQNREVSWMRFDERVLLEAEDESVPLFERLKFVEIFTSNLDEFYMVRVGSLLDMEEVEPETKENKGLMTPREQLEKIFATTAKLYPKREELFFKLNELLKDYGICHYQVDDLEDEQEEFVEAYFTEQVLPLLSPQIIDSHHPFPHLDNKRVYVAALLKYNRVPTLGIISLPDKLGRVIRLPGKKLEYVLLEDVIAHYVERVFSTYAIIDRAAFTITRNADIDVDDLVDVDREGGLDLDEYLENMKRAIKMRRNLAPLRLELQTSGDSLITPYLTKRLNISPEQVFVTTAPVVLNYVYGLEDSFNEEQKKALCYKPFTPVTAEEKFGDVSMMELVNKQEILLKYPYDDFGILLKLVKEAANSDDVTSIKLTVYRIGRAHVQLMNYLIMAAESGKDVTVLLEIKARFDEENNMAWVESLRQAGCKILYGFERYKVHAKVCAITVQKGDEISYITHIGTGNFNAKTAKLYTDFAFITSDPVIGRDATALFRNMGIGELHGKYDELLVAPENLKSQLLKYIKEETDKAKKGKKGKILLKMNSFTDRQLIDALYEAGQAGVHVDMIIRGISCLLPQIPGKTENIHVRSVVGRFLEHARVFCFGEGRSLKMYIASADWMTRNTENRVEVACPIKDKNLKAEIMSYLETQLADNQKARIMGPDGVYEPVPRKARARKVNAQEEFLKHARD